ncbi:MAG: hypothetical protein ACI4VF_10495 [Lachnospirales bacterium]
MKNPAKAIKIVSVIILIWGILALILGVVMTAGGGVGAALATSHADSINASAAGNADLSSSLAEFNNTYGTNASASDAVSVLTIAVLVLGISTIVGAIFDIISAIFGFRAAKGKSAKPAFVMGIITIIFAVISFVLSISTAGLGSSIISLIISLVIPIIYTYAAYQLKKEQA